MYTKPAAGVMPTRPATAPVAAPTAVGLPSLNHSIRHQVSRPAEAEVVVVRKGRPAVLAANMLAPLKPNQPNQSRPAPNRMKGTLWGGRLLAGQVVREPIIAAATRAATPEAICTTVPPAKSMAPIMPSAAPRKPPPQTILAMGEYTSRLHSRQNQNQALKLMRSTRAPEIRAGVMIANMPWNRAKEVALIGKPGARGASPSGPPGIKGKAVADHDPQHADQPHQEETHHHGVEHVLGACEAAVEERQARGHQQHQGGAEQHQHVVGAIGGRALEGGPRGSGHQGKKAGAQGHRQEGGAPQLRLLDAGQEPVADLREERLGGGGSAGRKGAWHQRGNLIQTFTRILCATGCPPPVATVTRCQNSLLLPKFAWLERDGHGALRSEPTSSCPLTWESG